MSNPSNFNQHDFNQALITEFRTNGGKLSGQLANSRILLLDTVGAKSGERRTTPLGYGMDGDRFIVIAANAGAPAHPDWYYNMRANPDVTVELGNAQFPVHASTAEGAERERLFAQRGTIVPWFDAQQEKTSRQIPFVILERTK